MKVKYYNIKEGRDKFCEMIRLVEQGLLNDKDVINWIKEMDKMALLPKKR
jgi:hypothetical protein